MVGERGNFMIERNSADGREWLSGFKTNGRARWTTHAAWADEPKTLNAARRMGAQVLKYASEWEAGKYTLAIIRKRAATTAAFRPSEVVESL